MNLDQIVTFLKVYQLGSYHEAAEQLFLPQPTISHRINQLEKELGKTLLIRGKGKVLRLTEEGKAFLPYARAALGSLEAGRDAVERVREGATGKLTIGCNNSFATCVLPEVLDSFAAKHPNVSMKVYCYAPNELVRLMKERLFQIGITRYTSNDADLTYRSVHSSPTMLFVSPQHPFAKRKKVSLEEIMREPLIAYQKETQYRKMLDVTLNQFNLQYKAKYETNNLYLIKHFIRSNVGVHLSGPIYMKQEVLRKEIVGIEIEHNPFPMNHIFIVHRQNDLNSLDHLFIRHFDDNLNESFGLQLTS